MPTQPPKHRYGDPVYGTRIRAMRQEQGLTLVDVGRRVGKSWQLICHIEAGRRAPTPPVAEALEDMFGIAYGEEVPVETAVAQIRAAYAKAGSESAA